MALLLHRFDADIFLVRVVDKDLVGAVVWVISEEVETRSTGTVDVVRGLKAERFAIPAYSTIPFRANVSLKLWRSIEMSSSATS